MIWAVVYVPGLQRESKNINPSLISQRNNIICHNSAESGSAISFRGDDLGCEEGRQPDNLKTNKKRSVQKEGGTEWYFSLLRLHCYSLPPRLLTCLCWPLTPGCARNLNPEGRDLVTSEATSWTLDAFQSKSETVWPNSCWPLQQRYASVLTPCDLSLALPFIAVPPGPSCLISTSQRGREREMWVWANTLLFYFRLFLLLCFVGLPCPVSSVYLTLKTRCHLETFLDNV